MKGACTLLLSCCLLLFSTSVTVLSQPMTARHGFGPQIGFSVDPGQFIFGGQAVLSLRHSHLHLGTSVDFGLTGDQSVYTLYIDLTYDFASDGSRTVWYAGGGPTVAHIEYDEDDRVPGGSETKLGITLIGGVKLPVNQRDFLNASFRPSFGDVHELKFMVGYMFGFGSM